MRSGHSGGANGGHGGVAAARNVAKGDAGKAGWGDQAQRMHNDNTRLLVRGIGLRRYGGGQLG